jgi:diguanylate cyclase (GGDEF)-like protein/PAS domain S-box-containing protein
MLKMTVDPSLLLNQIYTNVRDFAILTTDLAAGITSWNAGAEAIMGFAADEMIGTDGKRLFTPEDVASGKPEEEMSTASNSGRAADRRWHMRKDGSRFWADGVMTPMLDDSGQLIGYLKILRDLTETKLAQDQVQQLACVDGLTGLFNRAYFDLRRTELMALSRRTGELMLLLMIDLDRFKEVNDTFGHHAGDLLLQQVAQRIRAACRDSDVIARLGGDEFAVMQLNPPAASAGATLAAKLLDVLAEPFLLEGQEAHISASIGIAVCPADARMPEELLKKADLALYEAKSAGRNCYHYFTQEMDDASHRRLRDQYALRRANTAKAFQLVYQPIIDSDSGQPVAFEALLRISAPELAAFPINYMIDLAKETGLIADIGYWVLDAACAQLAQWKSAGLMGLRIAVNTCAKELLDPNYVCGLRECIRSHQLQPAELEIELTERDAIELDRSASNILHELARQGFRLVLDDFGTGYSSLSYLRTLPVSAIKLDKSFLNGVPEAPDANAVARAVIALAHRLKLEVTAEGIESPSQAAFLDDLHCTSFQGYLFCRALNAEAATRWLTQPHQPPRRASVTERAGVTNVATDLAKAVS